MGADEAQGPLRVLERNGMPILRGMAVLEDDAGDAQRIEPAGNVVALIGDGKPAISAAGTNYDRCAVRLFRLGQMDVDAWNILVTVHGIRRRPLPQRLQRRLRFFLSARQTGFSHAEG